jgi:hypothetical protein
VSRITFPHPSPVQHATPLPCQFPVPLVPLLICQKDKSDSIASHFSANRSGHQVSRHGRVEVFSNSRSLGSAGGGVNRGGTAWRGIKADSQATPHAMVLGTVSRQSRRQNSNGLLHGVRSEHLVVWLVRIPDSVVDPLTGNATTPPVNPHRDD